MDVHRLGETMAHAGVDVGLLEVLQTVTADVPAMVAFYRDILGAEVQSESEQWARVRVGGIDIGIHAAPAGYEGWMPAFRVANVVAVRAAVEARGFARADFHDIPGGVTYQFRDPSGQWLAAIQYGTTVAELTAPR